MRDSLLSRGAGFQQPSAKNAQPLRAEGSKQAKSSERATERLANKPGTGRKALVVDDVSDVTDLLSVVLTHAGYSVVTASSATQALNAAHDSQFDVVISDIGMPGMNGYQLARELRQLPGYKDTPLVAVTGYSMFDDRERSKSAGFNAHMTKPIDPQALIELIEQL